MRNFGQAMAASTVPRLTSLLQRHLVVLAISSSMMTSDVAINFWLTDSYLRAMK